MATISFPQTLQHIPKSYFAPETDKPGRLVAVHYNTFEAFSYDSHQHPLTKQAIVYLPASYDEHKRYNVFYLMHGGWSDETTYLGTPSQPHFLKNILDHAIADDKMKPMIVVCPTYNNTGDHDSSDYSLALSLTAKYHQELINDLLPAIEGQFSTYAETITPEGLRASRDHRAFAGFSMGSVTTWRVFQSCLAYFRYFFPSSGAITTHGSVLERWVAEQGFDSDDFFIFAASGTKDFAYPETRTQIQSMAQAPSLFKFANNSKEGNLYFLVAPGGVHGQANALEDFYNAMTQVWKEESLSDVLA